MADFRLALNTSTIRPIPLLDKINIAGLLGFDAIELHMRVFTAANEPQAAGLTADDATASPHVLVRPARAMADKLLRLRDELGFTYFTVSERFTDEFARVISLLAKA